MIPNYLFIDKYRCFTLTRLKLTAINFRKLKYIIMKYLIDMLMFIVNMIMPKQLTLYVLVVCIDSPHFGILIISSYGKIYCTNNLYFKDFLYCYYISCKTRYIPLYFYCNISEFSKLLPSSWFLLGDIS